MYKAAIFSLKQEILCLPPSQRQTKQTKPSAFSALFDSARDLHLCTRMILKSYVMGTLCLGQEVLFVL